MENILMGDDERYEGIDLMNSQKKILFQKLTEYIRNEQGELVYFLNWKDDNSQRHHKYTKEREYLRVQENDSSKIAGLENKIQAIDKIQGDILVILQSLFHESFTKVAQEVSPGIGYNERLRHILRFDFIFGERELSSATEGSREHYRLESIYRSSEERFQIKLQKRAEEMKKAKEKVRLPQGHRLIINENYPEMTKILIQNIESNIPIYAQKIGLDISDPILYQNFITYYLLYFLMNALLKEQLVFDTKSTKTKLCLSGTIDDILAYFNKKGERKLDIAPINIKRKFRNNINTLDAPMDLSYQHAMLEDIEQRESYLNTTYFLPYGNISINDLRKEIMTAYNSQKGVREKCFEMLNPRYHVYKNNEEKEKKHLMILKDHQKKSIQEDPQITAIIQEIEQKISYLSQKRKEHTKLEEKMDIVTGNYEHSLTEIQQRYLKLYKVPMQYWRIFGIVIDKLNNFYKTKSTIVKKSDEINEFEFQRLFHSDREFKDFTYYSQNFMTFARMNQAFDKKWGDKWTNRLLEIKNMCTTPQKYIKKQQLKQLKKSKAMPDQGLLDV